MLVKKPNFDATKPMRDQYRLVHNYVDKNLLPCSYPLFFFFKDAPPMTGQWGARRSTGGYNTQHDIFAPWAGVNEDHLYAHALATVHTLPGRSVARAWA